LRSAYGAICCHKFKPHDIIDDIFLAQILNSSVQTHPGTYASGPPKRRITGWLLRNPLTYRVKVFRRCTTFQIALGFAHLPNQIVRILNQRLRPCAESLIDQSLHERVPNQMPGYCFSMRVQLADSDQPQAQSAAVRFGGLGRRYILIVGPKLFIEPGTKAFLRFRA
jgi:hypothetical protein